MTTPPLLLEINRIQRAEVRKQTKKPFEPVESPFWEYDYYFQYYNAYGITIKSPIPGRSLKFPLLVYITYNPTTHLIEITVETDTIIEQIEAPTLSRATYLLHKNYIFLEPDEGRNLLKNPLWQTPTYW